MFAVSVQVICLLAYITLISLSTGDANYLTTQKTTDPGLIKPETNQDESLSVLKDALPALSNLTAIQERVWDQQRAYEQELLVRHREEEARQAARSTALEEEQQFLKSIWGTLSRQLKALARSMDKGSHSVNKRPKDCADLYLDGEEVSGVYQVWPTWSRTNFSVYCDMETDGGGWTVVHRWGNYSFPNDYFRRSWEEYKRGFGNLETAFWLGNEQIYALTSQGAYELRFDMDGHPENTFAQYRGFWIESEAQTYKARVEAYVSTGTTGDIFSSSNGTTFSTFDKHNYNCQQNQFARGWWFDSSCRANQMFTLSFAPSTTEEHKVLRKEMKIRPAQFRKMKEIS